MESVGFKRMPVGKGKVTLVDDDVYEWASKHKWFTNKDHNVWYVKRGGRQRDGIRKPNELLHRTITGAKPGEMVDHINGDGLDNRRCNLRVCSNSENQRNRGKPRNNTSGKKGVSWHASNKKWIAGIRVDGRLVHLGYYDDLEKAGEAYAKAAAAYYGGICGV
jgi:hypothetical protein